MLSLVKIANEIKHCAECKKGKSGLPVAGEGNPHAKIMLIGEAPGTEEAKTGKPFVGMAGRFLASMMESIGLQREDVFITSPLKYYPGKRPPMLKEIEHGKIHLLQQIGSIKPKIIVLLGKVACKSVGVNKKMRKEGVLYLPTVHPAAAMRFPKMKKKMLADFKMLNVLLRNL